MSRLPANLPSPVKGLTLRDKHWLDRTAEFLIMRDLRASRDATEAKPPVWVQSRHQARIRLILAIDTELRGNQSGQFTYQREDV